MLTKNKNIQNRRRVTGQGMTEYIIIVGMIALAAIVAVGSFGGVVQDSFISMGQKLTGNGAVDVKATETAAKGATTLKAYQQ